LPGTPDREQPRTVRFADSSASVLLDVLRGTAAILVMLGHWKDLFFVNYGNLAGHKAALLIPYLVAGAGHQAVVVFFVLSGYFIGGTVLSSVRRERWSWTDYLLRRCARLWVVLVPALLLCVGWDALGIHLGNAPLAYHGLVKTSLLPNVVQNLAPHVFFSNLFFLQTIFTPALGSDGALWSLAYEFWYYMLFPLAFFALRSATRVRQRIVCTVLLVAVALLVRGLILEYFPIWLAGVAVYRLPPPKWTPKFASWMRILVLIVYLPVFFGIAKQALIPLVPADYILAVCTVGLLWVLLSAQRAYKPGPSVRIGRGMARFSYSLYALHLPILLFLSSMVVGDSLWEPSFPHLAVAAGPLLLAVGYAWAIASFTEFKTDIIRKRLELLLGFKTPAVKLYP